MKLTDDFDDNVNKKMPLTYMILSAGTIVVLIIVLVLYFNKDDFSSNIFNNNLNNENNINVSNNNKEDDFTSDDLTFWDKEDVDDVEDSDSDGEDNEDSSDNVDDDISEDIDLSEGGTKTKLIIDDEVEWVKISKYVEKNKYDFTQFSYKTPEMQYFNDGEKISKYGMLINESHSIVDFNELKRQGVDFVMICLGQRGYESGKLTLDEYFNHNIKNATDAGVLVGVYFESYAISDDEIKEEVAFINSSIGEYEISYPIALKFGETDMEASRADSLKRMERMELVKTFSSEVKSLGFNPILYGDKEFLIKDIELSQLDDVDVWLSQKSDLPDYPYSFKMWDYETNNKINGIYGEVDLIISFIDYRKK